MSLLVTIVAACTVSLAAAAAASASAVGPVTGRQPGTSASPATVSTVSCGTSVSYVKIVVPYYPYSYCYTGTGTRYVQINQVSYIYTGAHAVDVYWRYSRDTSYRYTALLPREYLYPDYIYSIQLL